MDETPLIGLDLNAAEGWVVVLWLAGLLLITLGVGYGILRASREPHPTMLVMALSMLTLLSIVGYAVTLSKEFGMLVGVGMGALAGAVNSVFRQENGPGSGEKKEKDQNDSGPPTGSDPG
jgi:uncharacterized membrane protein YoaK (UPF0700 family)